MTFAVIWELNTPPRDEPSQLEGPGGSLQKLSLCADMEGASSITSTMQENSDGLSLAGKVFKR